jgi:hypothetical protein
MVLTSPRLEGQLSQTQESWWSAFLSFSIVDILATALWPPQVAKLWVALLRNLVCAKFLLSCYF